jgi:hypothetical protein
VVFIPLLVLGAVVYALVPRFRSRIGWAVVILSVVTPLTTWFAKLSGDAFRRQLIADNILNENSQELLDQVNDHASFGNITLYLTIALGVASLLLVLVTSRLGGFPTWGTVVLGVIVIGLGVSSGYYVFWTGDSGARAVWEY